MKKLLNLSMTKNLFNYGNLQRKSNMINSAYKNPILNKPKRFYYEGRENKVFQICITGGPCAGKTTALAEIGEMFPDHIVYSLPELATLVMTAGQSLDHSKKKPEQERQLVRRFINHMMETENYFIDVAKHEKQDVIILADRGASDPKPYSDKETWDLIMKEAGWSEDDLTNNRYDLVLHLVSAADGAVEYYTTSNNQARRETVEQAKALDRMTQSAWLNHHTFKIIHNRYGSFQGKINKIIETVGTIVGYKPSFNIESKYLLPFDFDVESSIPNYIARNIYQQQVDYLAVENPNEVAAYVSKRYNVAGNYTYTHTVRHLSKEINQRREEKRLIKKSVYRLFHSQKDPQKKTLHKQITAFNYHNYNFVIEEFYSDEKYKEKTHVCLRYDRNISEDGIPIILPKWLPIVKDVSKDKEFHSHNLASKN